MAQVLADTAQYSVEIAGKKFDVLSFDAYDEMSRLFRFTLTLRCDDPQVNIKGLLRKKVDVHLSWQDKEKWWFGIVASMSQVNAGLPDKTNEEGEYGEYVAEVVPSYWIMSQKTNCKIFQDMTVKDILEEVLDKRGMAGKYELKLTKGYEQREYCVQYRETDFAFLSRLMEEEGIFYWFWHDPDEKKDILTISDAVSGYAGCWPEDTVEFKKATGVLSTDVEYLSALTYEENAYTGKVSYRDWNYRDPRKPPVKVNATAEQNQDLDIYDYHLERYKDDGRGQFLAQMAVEAQSAMRETLAGSGNFRSLSAGHRFTLEKAYRDDLNKEWVVISCTHSASQREGGVDYAVSFTAIPAGTVFRPMPRTPLPTINMQTAIVVGPQGAEIHMDQYGRAKVQFHWDLVHEYEPDSSCWVRVAQPYAGINESSGDKHGFQWHPLIGDEVVVDFLEGDPDNPIIVGSVYNYVNMQPIKPEWLISSCILSPYQHSLVFDDKYKFIRLNTPYPHALMMNDPGKHTHLTTKYQNALKLQDPHRDFNDIPHIILETGGAEQIKLEDNDTKLGNNIQMKTADGHLMQLADGPDLQGVLTSSKNSNLTILNDKDEHIVVQTTNGHRVLMDDKHETIVVTSRDQHRIEINDKKQYIEVADSSGQHRFTIDIKGKQLTISTDTGSIDILAPSGTVKIDAKAVKVNAQTSVDVTCKDMSTTASSSVETEAKNVSVSASSKHEVEAMTIEESATKDIKMDAMNITSKASMKNKTQGAFVNAEASGINTIKGSLVKIN
jgi:type VI secretion system VgrG family protein